MKILKILIAFLISLSCYAPFSVYATEIVTGTAQEECPSGNSCTYSWDDNLGVYMLSNVEEMTDDISVLTDSATNTVISSIEVELYRDTYDIYKIFTYPDTNTFAADDINKINFYWSTEYNSSQYINVNFKLTLNHTSSSFYLIDYISVSGEHITDYVVQGNTLIIDHTVNPNYSTGTMYVAINFTSAIDFNDTITINASVEEDPNGALNSTMSSLNSSISSMLSKLNEIIPLIDEIEAHVISIDNLLANSIVPILSSINTSINTVNSNVIGVSTAVNNLWTNLNASLNVFRTSVSTEFSNLKSDISTHFTNLSDWIQSQTNSINTKLDEVINAIKGEDETTDSITENMDNSTYDFDDIAVSKSEIEVGIMNDSLNNINNIDLNNNLFSNNDFLITANFISTQMNNIVNSNDVYKTMVTYGLILGLACTFIGIAVRR